MVAGLWAPTVAHAQELKQEEPSELPAPTADDQFPRPVPRTDADAPFDRVVEVGPDMGVTVRPAADDDMSYGAALTLGAHARIQTISDWLPVRLGIHSAQHSAEGGPKIKGFDGRLSTLELDFITLGASLEPTWHLTPDARVWLELGVRWSRFRVGAARSPDLGADIGPSRAGVALEWPLGIGGTIDIANDWVAVGANLSAAPVSNQSGSAFGVRQGTLPGGTAVEVQPLSQVSAVFRGVITLGIIL